MQQNDYTDMDIISVITTKNTTLIIPSQTQQSIELSLHTYKKEKLRMGPNGDQTVIKR